MPLMSCKRTGMRDLATFVIRLSRSEAKNILTRWNDADTSLSRTSRALLNLSSGAIRKCSSWDAVSELIINFARAGALVTAVDLSEKSLELAHKRAGVFELTDQIAFRQVNIEELPKFIPIQNFDLVYAFGVIHHTPNPDKAIASIRKYMGPNSELRMMVYAKNSWKRIMIDAGFDQPEAQFGCPIAFTYSEEEARALLHGFDVLNIKQDHIFPFVIEKYIRHEYEIVPWFAAMPSDMFQALKSNLGWHLLITAKLPV